MVSNAALSKLGVWEFCLLRRTTAETLCKLLLTIAIMDNELVI